MSDLPPVTMALTRHREPDWLLLEALESLALQGGVRGEILLLDQSPSDELAARFNAMSTDAVQTRYEPIALSSTTRARNETIRRAAFDQILFLDPDVVVKPGWAEALVRGLGPDEVGIVGTRIVPRWHRSPLLIAASGVVLDQYSIFDLGPERLAVERVVSACLALHRGRLGDEARFLENYGRSGGSLLSGAETELCRRARAAGLEVIYDGGVTVEHQILPERISYRWVLRRFFYAGATRALLGGTPRPSNRMAFADFAVLPLVVPPYVAGYLYGRRSAPR